MVKTQQMRVVSGAPLGADIDQSGETEFVTFLLADGDHLHVEMATGGLQTLSRHIEHAPGQGRDASDRPKEI